VQDALFEFGPSNEEQPEVEKTLEQWLNEVPASFTYLKVAENRVRSEISSRSRAES
jgi:hypothetical protein